MNSRTLALLLLASAASPAQVKLPPYEKKTLGNGATLILLRKPDVPLVTVRAIFRGGAEAEPAGLNGIAGITAELIRRGTASRSAEQINLELDSLGASLGGGADRQSSSLQVEFLARNAGRTLAILEDLLLQPAFPEAEVKKVLAQAADAAKAAKDNPGRAVSLYFNAFYYPAGHPYHYSGVADELSIKAIGRPQIVEFHKRLYAGRNLILIAAGDFEPAAMGERLSAIAQRLPAGEAFRPAQPTPPAHASTRLLLVDKPDATQTYFQIGMPGIHRLHPERVPLLLVNTLFGGRFTSMLNDALRVNAGLTYGANSQLSQDRLPGAIVINSYTRTDSTVKAIDLALEILKQLNANGITAEQLNSAKAYIKGGYPTQRLETADQLASVLADLEMNGLNKGEIDDFFSRIDAVTLEQANAAIRKHYRPENLQFCLVGTAAKIQEGVKKYSPAMKVVSILEPGLLQ